jgi:hypothetical protein
MRYLILCACLMMAVQANADCYSYNDRPCMPSMTPIDPVAMHTSNYNYAQVGQDQTNQLLNNYRSQVPMFGAQQQRYGSPTNNGYMNPGSQGVWTP